MEAEPRAEEGAKARSVSNLVVAHLRPCLFDGGWGWIGGSLGKNWFGYEATLVDNDGCPPGEDGLRWVPSE